MDIANAQTLGGATLDSLEEEMHVALLGHCGNRTLMQAITLHQSLLIAHRFLYRWTPRLFATEGHIRVSRDRAIARIEVIRPHMTPEELPTPRPDTRPGVKEGVN